MQINDQPAARYTEQASSSSYLAHMPAACPTIDGSARHRARARISCVAALVGIGHGPTASSQQPGKQRTQRGNHAAHAHGHMRAGAAARRALMSAAHQPTPERRAAAPDQTCFRLPGWCLSPNSTRASPPRVPRPAALVSAAPAMAAPGMMGRLACQ